MSDLPPNLEWMLQSPQVTSTVLAEALVGPFYGPVYRLALALLDDERAAGEAARDVFRLALDRAARYHSGEGVELWLFRLALEGFRKHRLRRQVRRVYTPILGQLGLPYPFGSSIPQGDLDVALWRKVDRLPYHQRLPVSLYYLHGWDVPKIARLLGETSGEVRSALDAARWKFTPAVSRYTAPLEDGSPDPGHLDDERSNPHPQGAEGSRAGRPSGGMPDDKPQDARRSGFERPAPGRLNAEPPDTEGSSAGHSGGRPDAETPGEEPLDPSSQGAERFGAGTTGGGRLDADPQDPRPPLGADRPGKGFPGSQPPGASRPEGAGRLDAVMRRARAEPPGVSSPEGVGDGTRLDAVVRRSLAARWPAPHLSPVELERLAAEIGAETGPQAAHRRRSVSLNEIIWISVIALLAIALFWGANRLLPTESPSRPAASRPLNTPQRSATPLPQLTPTPERRSLSPLPSSPAPQSTPAPLPPRSQAPPSAWILHPVATGETLQDVAGRFGISVEELARRNGLEPGGSLESYRALEVPMPLPAPARPTPTPVRPVAYPLSPLGPGASPQDLYPYLLSSSRLWSSLWADAQYIDYGPLGYIGPPLVARSQVWVSQPDQSSQLVGDLEGQPYYHIVNRDGYSYNFSLYESMGWLDDSGSSVHLALLDHLLFPERFKVILEGGEFKVVGRGEAADREAVVVDWLNPEGIREWRLWIDTRSAVILHSQKFDAGDGETLLEEIILTAINFDWQFPRHIFNPLFAWSSFAPDPSGRQEPAGSPSTPATPAAPSQRPTISPPPNSPEQSGTPLHPPASTPSLPSSSPSPLPYSSTPLQGSPSPLPQDTPTPLSFPPELAHSRLTFQYSYASPIEPPSARSSPYVDLFAGDRYLGTIRFASPWGLLCDRSPDGRLIAFSPGRHWLDFSRLVERPMLRWVDLADVTDVHTLPIDLEVVDFAFSPESGRLAIVGIADSNAAEPGPGVYVFDLDTGDVRRVLPLQGSGRRLIWSPDGQFLGLIAAVDHWNRLESIIVDIRTGTLVYRNPVEMQLFQNWPEDPNNAFWPLPDTPVRDWTIPFPPRNLASCSAPPEPWPPLWSSSSSP